MIAFFFSFFCTLQAVFAFTPISPGTSNTIINDSAGATTNESRRQFISSIIGSTALVPLVISSNPSITNAAEETIFTTFKDPNVGFQLQVPTKWSKSEQTLPDRRKILLFVNNGDGEVAKGLEDLIFVAYTPIRDDFTSLGSFGTVDQVGQATILPKGQLAGQVTDNVMLSSESKKNAYYFDYTSKSPDQPKRHFRTIFTLIQGATGGAGSVLVTVTAQTLESRYDDEMKSLFDQIMESYRKL